MFSVDGHLALVPTLCNEMLVNRRVPCTCRGTLKNSMFNHCLPRRLPFTKVCGVRLARGSITITSLGLHRHVNDGRCVALTKGFTLDSSGFFGVLGNGQVCNYDVKCNLSDVFNPLRTSLKCSGRSGSIKFCMGLKFSFWRAWPMSQ